MWPVQLSLDIPVPSTFPTQDMADSRRINANICDEEQKLPEQERPPFSLVAIILSSEFWPPLKDEKLELPGQVKEAMEAYAKKYEKLKVGESSVWRKFSQGPLLQLVASNKGGRLSLLRVQPSSLLGFDCSFFPSASPFVQDILWCDGWANTQELLVFQLSNHKAPSWLLHRP